MDEEAQFDEVVYTRKAMNTEHGSMLSIQVVKAIDFNIYFIRLVTGGEHITLPGICEGAPEPMIERANRLVIEY